MSVKMRNKHHKTLTFKLISFFFFAHSIQHDNHKGRRIMRRESKIKKNEYEGGISIEMLWNGNLLSQDDTHGWFLSHSFAPQSASHLRRRQHREIGRKRTRRMKNYVQYSFCCSSNRMGALQFFLCVAYFTV